MAQRDDELDGIAAGVCAYTDSDVRCMAEELLGLRKRGELENTLFNKWRQNADAWEKANLDAWERAEKERQEALEKRAKARDAEFGAKQDKELGLLEAILEQLKIMNAESVVTLSGYKADVQEAVSPTDAPDAGCAACSGKRCIYLPKPDAGGGT